jgi:hypothetical protein
MEEENIEVVETDSDIDATLQNILRVLTRHQVITA